MSDEAKPEGQEPEGGKETTEATATQVAEEEFDRERALHTIRAQREELKAFKQQAAAEREELAAKLKEHEDAKLSAEERIAKERDELAAKTAGQDAELQEMRLRLAVYSQQATLGIADADLALAALDRARLEFDDTGQATNLTDVLGDLLEAKPILRASGEPPKPKAPNTNAGAGTTPGEKPELTSAELEMARKLGQSPEEFQAFRDVRTVEDYQRVRKELAKTD